MCLGPSLGILGPEVVRPQLMVGSVVPQHVVHDNEEVVHDGYERLLGVLTPCQTTEPRAERGALLAHSSAQQPKPPLPPAPAARDCQW